MVECITCNNMIMVRFHVSTVISIVIIYIILVVNLSLNITILSVYVKNITHITKTRDSSFIFTLFLITFLFLSFNIDKVVI